LILKGKKDKDKLGVYICFSQIFLKFFKIRLLQGQLVASVSILRSPITFTTKPRMFEIPYRNLVDLKFPLYEVCYHMWKCRTAIVIDNAS
jgi:hypothetical protein